MRIVCYLILCGITIWSSVSVCANEIRDVHSKIEKLVLNGSYDELPVLLNEIAKTRIKTLGGGVGPVTPNYLQFILVRNVFEERGTLKDITFDDSCNDEGCTYWKNTIKTFDDEAALTRMLESENPAVRLVAVFNINESGRSVKYKDRLEYMVENDPYVVIQRKQPELISDRPMPPGYTVNDFTAPIRNIIASSLSDRSGSYVDQRAVSSLGVTQLMRDYKEADERFRDEILFAIHMLDKRSYAIEYLRNIESSDILTDRQLKLMKTSIENYTELKMLQYRRDEEAIAALLDRADNGSESDVTQEASDARNGGSQKGDRSGADSQREGDLSPQAGKEEVSTNIRNQGSRKEYINGFYIVILSVLFFIVFSFFIYIYLKNKKTS